MALKETFGSRVSAPDCTGIGVVEERVALVMTHLGGEPAYLVGSSFGGLVAGLIATRHPELVKGMVLCAPAFHWKEAAEIKATVPTTIIHGTQDTVVPIEHSQEFCECFPDVKMIKTEDDHRLDDSLSAMLTAVQSLAIRFAQET